LFTISEIRINEKLKETIIEIEKQIHIAKQYQKNNPSPFQQGLIIGLRDALKVIKGSSEIEYYKGE